MRQECKGLYALEAWDFMWERAGKRILMKSLRFSCGTLSANAVNGLPCLRCGVNVCEVC
jgi:hypothetical protein